MAYWLHINNTSTTDIHSPGKYTWNQIIFEKCFVLEVLGTLFKACHLKNFMWDEDLKLKEKCWSALLNQGFSTAALLQTSKHMHTRNTCVRLRCLCLSVPRTLAIWRICAENSLVTADRIGLNTPFACCGSFTCRPPTVCQKRFPMVFDENILATDRSKIDLLLISLVDQKSISSDDIFHSYIIVAMPPKSMNCCRPC